MLLAVEWWPPLRFRRRWRLKNDWWNVDRFFVLTCSHAPLGTPSPSPRKTTPLSQKCVCIWLHFQKPHKHSLFCCERGVEVGGGRFGKSRPWLTHTTSPTHTHIWFLRSEREKLLLLCKVSQTHFLAIFPPPSQEVRARGRLFRYGMCRLINTDKKVHFPLEPQRKLSPAMAKTRGKQ